MDTNELEGVNGRIAPESKQILVPLDGSPLAEQALPHAAALARATSGGLLLIRVAPPDDPNEELLEASPEVLEAYEEQPQIARRYLDDVAEHLQQAGLQVDVEVTSGAPAEAILNYTAEHPEVTTIVMSTHGRSGVSRLLFGSVAERVLHGSPVPQLLLRPEPNRQVDLQHMDTPRYDVLLVPLDGSELAEQALPHAVEIAQACGGRLVLISVTSTPFTLKLVKTGAEAEWAAVPWDTPAEYHVNYLERVTKELSGSGVPVQARVTYGDVADEILKAAKYEHAALVVMATHGRGAVGQLLVGSIATRVVQAATIPVLLVRARQQAARHIPSATLAGAGTSGR